MLLCLVYIAVGLFSNSIFTAELATELTGTIDCWLRLLGVESNILLTNVSLLTATTINTERYLAIVHPIFHTSKITRRKFLLFIILSWSTCAVMLGVSFYASRPLLIYSAIVKLSFVLFSVFVYGKIAQVVISSKQDRKTLISQPQGRSAQPPGTVSDKLSAEEQEKKVRFLKELKVAKVWFYIIVCYMVCLSPAAFFLGFFEKWLQGYDYILALTWCVTLAMLNSTLNSVIFVWRVRHLRQEVKSVLKRGGQR